MEEASWLVKDMFWYSTGPRSLVSLAKALSGAGRDTLRSERYKDLLTTGKTTTELPSLCVTPLASVKNILFWELAMLHELMSWEAQECHQKGEAGEEVTTFVRLILLLMTMRQLDPLGPLKLTIQLINNQPGPGRLCPSSVSCFLSYSCIPNLLAVYIYQKRKHLLSIY